MKKLQTPSDCDKLIVRDGYIVCPVCRVKTNQVLRPETEAFRLQLWCRNCKAVHIVNIEHGQCYVISRCR